jgi:hypothetical protein
MTVGRFTRDRRGRFHPRLSPRERELLGNLPAQVLELIAAKDPCTRRLFPVAYPGDPAAEGEYQAMMGESLLDRHRHALDCLADTAPAETVAVGELEQWMGALEVLRLVLGTQLDVTEDMAAVDPGDPRAPGLALYGYLSVLQEEVVAALAGTLPKVEGDA